MCFLSHSEFMFTTAILLPLNSAFSRDILRICRHANLLGARLADLHERLQFHRLSRARFCEHVCNSAQNEILMAVWRISSVTLKSDRRVGGRFALDLSGESRLADSQGRPKHEHPGIC